MQSLKLAKFYLFSYAVLLMFVISNLAYAGPAREALVAFSHNLRGLDGQFTQQVLDNQGRLKESTSGRVALALPNRLRWEYTQPFTQLIVADGQKVWIYEADLEQVTVRTQDNQELSSPLTALLDIEQLERSYDLSEEAAARAGLHWLALNPKQGAEASFQYAELGFAKNELVRMEIADMLGQRTVIEFANWQKNPAFSTTTFVFTPTDNVDVIGEP